MLPQVRRLALIAPLVATLWIAPVSEAYENAYGWMLLQNGGAYSNIETGDPRIQDDPITPYDWSYMRVFVQHMSGDDVLYAEIGWTKWLQYENVPKVYWTFRRADLVVEQDFCSTCFNPGIGIYYNYELAWTTNGNNWTFFFNDSQVTTNDIGWNTAERCGSGGETSSKAQGMGLSQNRNVQARAGGGNWYACAPYNVYNTDPALYHVDPGENSSSWRVYGNN